MSFRKGEREKNNEKNIQTFVACPCGYDLPMITASNGVRLRTELVTELLTPDPAKVGYHDRRCKQGEIAYNNPEKL